MVKFTRSKCTCSFCTETHSIIDEWKTFHPRTNLQRRMLNVIKNIERKNKINT